MEAKKSKELLRTVEEYLHHQGLMEHKERETLLTELVALCHQTLNRLHRNFKRLGQAAQQVDEDKYELYQSLEEACEVFGGPKKLNSHEKEPLVCLSP